MSTNIGFAALAGVSFISLTIGFIVGFFIKKIREEEIIRRAEDEAKGILNEAKREADSIIKEAKLEARDELYRSKVEFDKETKERRQELLTIEKRLMLKEENIDKKVEVLEKKEKNLEEKENILKNKENELSQKSDELSELIKKEKQELQRISGVTAEDAKRMLLKKIEEDVKYEANLLIKRAEEETKEKADRLAKEIISNAIARCASDYTIETTVSTVPLPSDEMKGRIIGREGRNIRTLEQITGVDLIIDDTPEAVVISCFDSVRREIAKQVLEKLISDGRIHPARIEDVYEKTKKEMEQTLREHGETAVLETGIIGVKPEIIRLLGRLYYRTSYGQNVLQHSIETSFLMGAMAAELGLDIKLAKRIGLLHDIGKAVDHEIEGSHAVIGADICKKYGEPFDVVHAVRAHHHDEEPSTVYAVLIEAADAMSAARPGVRGETVETYVQRLEKLEAIANQFSGIEKSFAIQAGRELRVIVEPDKVDDIASAGMAREISKKIQEELSYPGQIKVIVIREMRSIEYAK